ncbi:hypothetical protein SLS60_005706 [Paraconiothyrium brasiliense]|uniref:Uncharacterized protein n=1 Tax=Paraconiothyrium brasiliense TaxID=300254 RepID=A0ABR3RIK5_9PLEO
MSDERNGKDKNHEHDGALKIKGQNEGLMDGNVQSKDYSTRIFDTPLPPSNPALNFALSSHQLKHEIMERAKTMSFTFAAEF